MRIAVACKGLEISHRFDAVENFALYTVVNGIIVGCQNLPYLQIEQEAMAQFFKNNDVTTLICDTISIDDARHYCANDIEVVAAVKGNAGEAVKQYLTKTLIGADEMCHSEDNDYEDGSSRCTL